MLPVIPFPAIDPVLIEFGPIAIRWYGLAYLAGLLLGWRYVRRLVGPPGAPFAGRGLTAEAVDDFVVWATIGVIVGGRLGSVLFYNFDQYVRDPLAVLYIWRGGMSFHGGMLGVAAALLLFAWRRRVSVFTIADPVACAAPIGLFFGRLANFINGELWGRPTDVPWAMVFPTGGPVPRHPSQLYEAALEGVVLFVVMRLLLRAGDTARRPGYLTGAFLLGYGVLRIVGEFFRQPDANIGFLAGGATMGQVLSLPMVAAGLLLVLWARRRPLAVVAKQKRQ